ncbi:MAG: ribulose-phosphate 3-epimerase [Phycisphaerales bacterium]|nr:ribulose-phosphate 3-epimerase [Phycisphaerales bacterium]
MSHRPSNLFTNPPRLPLVAPSILSADFARLRDDCAHVLDVAAGDLLHVDVMDGHFVPNLTMGPAIVRSLRAALPEAFLDVHVMVTDPIQYVKPFAASGANHLTFHVEPALDPLAGAGMSPLSGGGAGYDPLELVEEIHAAGMTAGLAINPGTSAETVLAQPGWVEAMDLILVMSVWPGFSGQAFIPEVLATAKAIKPKLGPNQRLEMDGGLGPETAIPAREAGVDVLVAASAVFGQPPSERAEAIRAIRG